MGFVYKIRLCAAVCSAVLLISALPAETLPALCGTHREGLSEELFLHSTARRSGKTPRLAELGRLARATDRDQGEIAVLGAGGGVVSQRNPFDLQGRSIGFIPTAPLAAAYAFRVESGGYDAGAADNATPLTGLGDDDFRPFDLPFDFPFYGKLHRRLFVHSDGNLTFEEPDAASASRSLGRMTAGPPRIAPLFADLDPSRAPGSVRVAALPDRVIVTWLNVPEFSEFSFAARQTVQVVLYPDGAIQLTLRQADIASSIAGIAPGRLSAPTNLVSFSDGSAEIFSGAVAERFGNSESVDTTLAAQRFYETHDDAYDFLVFFNALGIPAGPGALASELTVRSARQGIGDTPTAAGERFGSPYRLQAVLNMGPLSQYPLDPYQPVALRGQITGDNTMTLLGHETGHLFLALASVRDPIFPDDRPMLGAGLAHWSFNFNSEASLLEGNRIQDNGPTQQNRFLTIATVEGYSPLDQYLMGLRAPEEVPSTFVVYPASTSASRLPQPGVTLRGTRLDISVADLIRDEGPRVPDHSVEQRAYRFAFILIVPEGQEPDPAVIAQLERYRQEFTPYFRKATSERASADPTLRRMLRLSAWPASGIVAGRDARVTVETRQPVAEDLQIQLRPAHGITPPRSVTIPKGAHRAEFLVRADSAGVGDLLAEPVNPAYETVQVKMPIAPRLEALTVTLYYVGWSVVLRVVDGNGVPYSNLPMQASSSSGTVTPLYSWNTDESGFLYLDYRANGAAPRPTLTAEIEGAPATRQTFTLAP